MSVAGSGRSQRAPAAPAYARKVQATQLTGGSGGGVYWVKEKPETDELKINRRNPDKSKNWVTGDVYKGSWLGDRRHGFGIQIWANGNKYEGTWSQNKRHGHGVLWIKDDGKPQTGSSSTTNSKSNTTTKSSTVKIHASLTSTHQQNMQSAIDKQKAAVHMANLTAGTGGINLTREQQASAAAAAAAGSVNAQHVSSIPDGNGPVFDPRTKLRKLYAGNWKDGLKHGKGVYFYLNGASYEGEWRNGVREGKGTLYYTGSASGDVYVGEWTSDKQAGFGTLTKANGDIYEGLWLNGKREGEGMYYYKSKEQIFEGEWVADIPKCGVFMAAADFFVGKDAAAQAAKAKAANAAAASAAAASASTDTKTSDSKHSPQQSAADAKYPAAAKPTANTNASANAVTAAAANAATAAAEQLQKTLGSLRISDALAPVTQIPNRDPAILAEQLPKRPEMMNVGGSAEDLFDTPRFIRKEPKRPLPELRLANPDLVLAERIEQLQNERAAIRAMAVQSLEQLFDTETLDELRRAYSTADESGTGLVPITALKSLLESVGEPVTDPEFASLCVDLDKNASDRVTFAAFVKAVHLAKHMRALDRQNEADPGTAEQEPNAEAAEDDEGERQGGSEAGDYYDHASNAGGGGGGVADAANDTDDIGSAAGGDGGYYAPEPRSPQSATPQK